MKKLIYSTVAIAVLTASGCTSFSTTPITRHDSNAVSADSNGDPRWFCRSRPYKGIPIKVKVITHTDVFIDEDFMLTKGEKYESWKEEKLEHKFLSVRAEPVTTDQIVISDFKRPASGIIDLTVDFNDGYLSKIDSKVTDTTITDSAQLLATIISKSGVPLGGKALRSTQRTAWKKRTVAYQRFDISAPDYEEQLDAFISHHMNNCNQCSGYPTYDRVSEHTGHGLANLSE